ncbi:hypothetical protein GIB67_017761 [Kingdonia uniflora]|uniref:Uncharacterized protein n=1 Tax=Kingdonia uniflora TaxID=39325 RepID=A0A7J7LQC1_9MAGN|nr:hypothetical protein GIB67_017761 [Kingdonia uniflora]
MVKTRSMVLEERIASEIQRLKLKYFGDRSLEMAIPSPIPLTYQGLSGEEAIEAEEDFYNRWRFYAFILTGEERWACPHSLAEDRVRASYAGKERERQKIRGFDNELSEGDKRLKNAKDYGSRRWQCSSIVRGKLDSTTDSYSDTEGSDAFREFCKAKAAVGGKWGNCVEFAGRTWNDNIIWVKGNWLQRDEEEPLDLRFRTVKQSVKSTVERKESLLDDVAKEETELELVLEGLSLSRKKRVHGATESGEVAKEKRRKVESSGEKVAEVRPVVVDDLREVEEMARLAALHGEEDTNKMVARLVKGIWLGIEEEKSELKKAKNELEKDQARAKTEAMKEVRQLKASHVMVIGHLQVKVKDNLDKMVEERDRLGRHLMLKGYSEEEVDVIKADTYVEEGDDEEAEAMGVVDDLDSISRQIVLEYQGDDVDLQESGSKKVVREMSLRINDLESGLARERETSKALLSKQAELQVQLDISRAPEDDALMCNWEFTEQFDRMKEISENGEDRYEKAHSDLRS